MKKKLIELHREIGKSTFIFKDICNYIQIIAINNSQTQKIREVTKNLDNIISHPDL